MTGVFLNLQIVGVGLYCPVGLTAQTACAAMRAGLSRFEELDYVDKRGEPLYGARVPVIDGSLAQRRCAALLSGALANLLRDTDPELVARCPALLVTRTNWPRTERALVEVMPSPPMTIMRGGPGADLVALEQAAALHAERATQVLICAVDSSINARALHSLREAGRLRSSSNPQGVLPGEAAACVLVERVRPGAAGMSVVSLGVAHEPATLTNELPLRAEGLSGAMRQALEAASCKLHDVDWRLANHGDEGFFVKEHSLALARLLEEPKAALPLWQPAEFIGELGVAAGLTQLIWATQAWARGYAPGRTALCICSDPEGPRSAVVIRCC